MHDTHKIMHKKFKYQFRETYFRNYYVLKSKTQPTAIIKISTTKKRPYNL